VDKFLEIFADALQKDMDSISLTDKFRDYDEWDSIAVLSVGAAINDEYDLVLPRSIYESFKTVADIYQYIEQNKQ
jgi:acyl carrier protein